MMQRDEYPLDLGQPAEDLADEYDWKLSIDHHGETWQVFSTVYGTETVHLWCCEGFGYSMHKSEWEAIEKLVRSDIGEEAER